MIKLIESDIKIPPCPKKERSINYKSKCIKLKCSDGDYNEFNILPSRSDAESYVMNLMNGYCFPMASSLLKSYQLDNEYYEDSMKYFHDYGKFMEEDDLLYILSGGKSYFYDGTDPYNECIELFRKAARIDQLIHSTGWDVTVYKAFIDFEQYGEDEQDGMWRESTDPCAYADGSYEDYKWHRIGGTQIMIPKWANSINDVISR